MDIIKKLYSYRRYSLIYETKIREFYVLYSAAPSLIKIDRDTGKESPVVILNPVQYQIYRLINLRSYQLVPLINDENSEITGYDVFIIEPGKSQWNIKENNNAVDIVDELTRSYFTHPRIEALAYQIYQNRIASNLIGNQLQDWLAAEKQLKYNASIQAKKLIDFLNANKEFVLKTLEYLERYEIIFDINKVKKELLTVCKINEPAETIDIEEDTRKGSFVIHITDKCNLSCSYCYVNKDGEHLTAEKGETYLNRIFEGLKDCTHFDILWVGGEPFYNYDVLIHLMKHVNNYAKKRSIKVKNTISTNGTLITKERIEEIISIDPDVEFGISIDGIEDIHGKTRFYPCDKKNTFEDIMKNVDLLKKFNIKFRLKTFVNTNNISTLPQLVDFYLKNKFNFTISRLRENNYSNTSTIPSVDSYIEAIKNIIAFIRNNHLISYPVINSLLLDFNNKKMYPCGAGRGYFAVSEKGTVSACHWYLDNPYGSIFDEDIFEKIYGNVDKLSHPIDSIEDCKLCFWRYLCRGDCPIHTSYKYGSSKKASPYCKIFQELIPELIHFEADRLIKQVQQ
jgi:uncharacterized protein